MTERGLTVPLHHHEQYVNHSWEVCSQSQHTPPFSFPPADQIEYTLPLVYQKTVTLKPYPPAMAPTIRSGSFPCMTASGRGESAGSSDRSCPQA